MAFPINIPTAEIQRYMDYAIAVATKLESLDIAPDTMLWHYTNGAGLLGILSSHSLYSTHVSCLNDSSEIRFSSKLFRDALLNSRGRFSSNILVSYFIERASEYFEEDPDVPNHVSLPYFVSCFSEVPDDLSQWRGYGGGENGYALGFRAKDLKIQTGILARVTYYEEAKHAALAAEVADNTINFFHEGYERFANGEIDLWLETFFPVWDECITQVAPLVKHVGFSTEKEVRLIRVYNPSDVQNLRFIQKPTMLTRHLPLTPGSFPQTPYRLPIAGVMVGPCRYRHVSRLSVGTLLQQCGYDSDLVSISDSPFQAT